MERSPELSMTTAAIERKKPRSRLAHATMVTLALCVAAACGVYLPPRGCRAELRIDVIKLPPGFSISVYASGLSGARSLALGDRGTVFVGTREEGKVYAVPSLPT